MTLKKEQERATIAELEMYGLSVRLINAIEDGLGALYVDQLQGVTEEELVDACGGRHWGNPFGPNGINQLRQALQNFLEDHPIKTAEECMQFEE